jgi:hypothetical protein
MARLDTAGLTASKRIDGGEAEVPMAAIQVEADPRASYEAIERRWLQENGVDATSRFVELANPRLRVHALECGSGEPAVVLHGGDGEGADWAPLMGPLQDRLTSLQSTVPASA